MVVGSVFLERKGVGEGLGWRLKGGGGVKLCFEAYLKLATNLHTLLSCNLASQVETT